MLGTFFDPKIWRPLGSFLRLSFVNSKVCLGCVAALWLSAMGMGPEYGFGASVSSRAVAKARVRAEAEAMPEAEMETDAIVRLQVFLDRVEFPPGKIDGQWNTLTRKALALYREARDGTPADLLAIEECDGQWVAPPDVSGLELGSMGPTLVIYTVTDADLESVGRLPETLEEQQKAPRLPYQDVAEALAEKFHTNVDFLAERNPGITSGLKAGDRLLVPNVVPFEYADVKTLKEGEDLEEPVPVPMWVRVDTRSDVLLLYEGQLMVAAYPVSVGAGQTESPVGEWRVRGVTRFPSLRYDEAMLLRGEHSANFYMLPPGPNNPLGVVWISLNHRGIGLHGTNEPEQVGLAASHGCVRLANWDIVRLARKVRDEVRVVIE